MNQTPAADRERYVTLARWSWISPGISIVLSAITAHLAGMPWLVIIVLAALQLLLVLLGGIFSIVALFATRRHGPEEIKGPALAGLFIFLGLAGLLALIVPGIAAAVAHAISNP